MIRIIAGLILLLTLFIYGMLDEEKKVRNTTMSFHYVSIDTSSLKYKQKAYVPVNRLPKKTKRREQIVLKVRNTSSADSIYLSHIKYYDAQGNLLSNSADSVLLIQPMATAEIPVHSHSFKESLDNLVVQWHSNSSLSPIVQAVTLDGGNGYVACEQGVLLNDDLRVN